VDTDEEYRLALDGVYDEEFFLSCKMGVWGKRPPFALIPSEALGLQDTGVAQSILHGIRLRKQKSQDVRRRMELKAMGLKKYLLQLRGQIVALQATLEAMRGIDYAEGSADHAMLQLWLQWDAREIYHLYHLQFLN
jgi:hypothetical protein